MVNTEMDRSTAIQGVMPYNAQSKETKSQRIAVFLVLELNKKKYTVIFIMALCQLYTR